MKAHRISLFLVSVAVLLLASGCAGNRAPSPKTAQSMTQSYFKGYGKKYKTSVIGKHPVQKVEINQVYERSRQMAEVDAFLNLKDGGMARVVLTTKNSPPFGWTVVSWEMLDLQ